MIACHCLSITSYHTWLVLSQNQVVLDRGTLRARKAPVKRGRVFGHPLSAMHDRPCMAGMEICYYFAPCNQP